MNIHEGKVNHNAKYSRPFDNSRSKLTFAIQAFTIRQRRMKVSKIKDNLVIIKSHKFCKSHRIFHNC